MLIIQELILQGYDLDFSKHAPQRILERMRLVWQALPSQLAKENRKFVFGAVRKGGRARDFEESIQWLTDYGVITPVSNVSTIREPLPGYDEISAFKLFCVDTGLLGALAGLNPATLIQGSHVFTEFKGALTEQYVIQQLIAHGFSPHYWATLESRAEIDALISLNGTPIPIEVKAAENLRSRSLKAAVDRFNLPKAVRTSLSGHRDQGWMVNIPLWAIGNIRHALGAAPKE